MNPKHNLSFSVLVTRRIWHALLIALLVSLILPQPAPAAPTWTTVESMSTTRWFHTATLLPNGKVLVAGGQNSGGYLDSAEVYDPSSNTWTSVAHMNTARWFHTATLLPSGKVLVAGGRIAAAISTARRYTTPVTTAGRPSPR